MNIAAFVNNDGACEYYRIALPLKRLGREDGVSVDIISKSDSPDTIYDVSEAADIIVARGVADKNMVEWLEAKKKAGKKIVVDYDDNIFDISPFSPHYQEHGLEQVEIEMASGEKRMLWEDGKNIDLATNHTNIESFKYALEMADAVSVTTEKLAKVYREYNDKVIVMPNCIDTNLWKPLPFIKTEEVRLSWFGGHSHYEDWCLLSGVLPDIMKAYPQVKLVLMGARFDGTLKGIPKDRIEYHSWVPTPAYPYKAAILNPTISLIPLVDNRFNECKSPIKWIEQSALGVPSVVSNVSPYKEIMDGDNGVFVDNEPDAWYRGISNLIDDSILRAKIGGNAQRTVMDRFDIDNEYMRWMMKYEGIAA